MFRRDGKKPTDLRIPRCSDAAMGPFHGGNEGSNPSGDVRVYACPRGPRNKYVAAAQHEKAPENAGWR